jgi:hypothetical protein
MQAEAVQDHHTVRVPATLEQAVLEVRLYQRVVEDLQAVYYTMAPTALAMLTAVVVVEALTTFVVARVVYPEGEVVQDLLPLVRQILEDSTQTPFTVLGEMAAEDKLDLLIL